MSLRITVHLPVAVLHVCCYDLLLLKNRQTATSSVPGWSISFRSVIKGHDFKSFFRPVVVTTSTTANSITTQVLATTIVVAATSTFAFSVACRPVWNIVVVAATVTGLQVVVVVQRVGRMLNAWTRIHVKLSSESTIKWWSKGCINIISAATWDAITVWFWRQRKREEEKRMRAGP